MVVIVLLPAIVNLPAPSLDRVQLNVEPPPSKVLAPAAVILIIPVPVPAVVVNPTGLALEKAPVLASVHFNVPPLKVKFFVPVAAVLNCVVVRIYPT